MPYIDQDARLRLGEKIGGPEPYTPGELNFCFTMLAVDYLRRMGHSYTTINAILGAFDCAAREFYRRVAVSYEQEKCNHNGDVYDEPPQV
jgi:hypothetical protein